MNRRSGRLRTTSSSDQVRIHSRRVAIAATLLALLGGLIVCAIADLIVVNHIYGAIDARLRTRLTSIIQSSPSQSGVSTPIKTRLPAVSSEGDFDDAPILAWFIPKGSTNGYELAADTPKLPSIDATVTQPTKSSIAGRNFRLEGAAVKTGRYVVATSSAEVGNVLSTLLTIQGVLAPIALLSLFIASTIIGRRAARPIENARLRQLEFTADASHELRTPLSVIEAEVSLALSTTRTAAAYRGALERVDDESKRLRNIVNDLLWLARLDSLPTGPPHEPVDVATIVDSCAERFNVIALQRGVTLNVNVSGSHDPVVVAPVDWLDRLVSVLMDNACRYANDGGNIEVSVTTTDDRVTLIVDDSGLGFTDAEREHVLQRFHRASTLPGGAGLGLAIASAVVDATEGTIELGTSALGGARVAVSWARYSARNSREKMPELNNGNL
jgi:signal transduction histidine kinase